MLFRRWRHRGGKFIGYTSLFSMIMLGWGISQNKTTSNMGVTFAKFGIVGLVSTIWAYTVTIVDPIFFGSLI